MCAQHGPSLPLDQQLHRILEQEVLHPLANLRPNDHILRRFHDGICLAREHPVVTRHLLLLPLAKGPREARQESGDIGRLHAQWRRWHPHVHVPSLPRLARPF